MDNELALALLIGLGILLGFMLGFSFAVHVMRMSAVKRNLAAYNPKTAEFEWKYETKTEYGPQKGPET